VGGKEDTYNFRSLQDAALSSRLQNQAGIKIDPDQMISAIMEFGYYRSDQGLVKLWDDKCSTVMDWLLDVAEAAGIKVNLDPATKSWYFSNYPTISIFLHNYQKTLAEMLLRNGRKRGVESYFKSGPK
jgi:hypothetical protein